MTIVEPSGNSAPVPTFARSCTGLTCSVSSQGTVDPNTGDTITYSWNWGDGTAPSTGATPAAHVYAAAGHLHDHAHDHGRLGQVRLDHPRRDPGRAGRATRRPLVEFTDQLCSSFTMCQMNSAGTVDPEGDAIRYSWNWGDATGAEHDGQPGAHLRHTWHLHDRPDGHRRLGQGRARSTRDVTITEPAGNNAPTAVIASAHLHRAHDVCDERRPGAAIPTPRTGDGIRNYVWSWGDGTPDTTGTSASQSHVFPVAGTYTVTLHGARQVGPGQRAGHASR